MPQVSIITPTINRQDFLPALWRCVQAQSIHDIEWLVHDGSPDPAPMFNQIQDERISYVHAPGEMSIGAKRNALCDVARSEIIAHFDDDDFYAPHYLEGMLSSMNEQKVEFIKLLGFFLYCRRHYVFAYWDLEIGFPIHFRLHPTEPPTLISLPRRRLTVGLRLFLCLLSAGLGSDLLPGSVSWRRSSLRGQGGRQLQIRWKARL